MEQQCGLDFEYFVQAFFDDRDITVFETPLTNDYGADLVLYRLGKVAVIQCKYHSSPIGVHAVQEVVGAIKYYRADCGIVVTNQSFTKQAIALAEANHVLLLSGSMLQEMIDSTSDEIPYLDEFLAWQAEANSSHIAEPPQNQMNLGGSASPDANRPSRQRMGAVCKHIRLRHIRSA